MRPCFVAVLFGLAFSLALVFPSCALSANDSKDPVVSEATDRWVMGYYVGYQHGKAKPGESRQEPSDINFDYLTHVAVGVGLVRPDGTLDLRFYHNTPEEGSAWAREVVRLAHVKKRKALLMIGGEGNGDEILSALRNHREAFLGNIVSALETFGFDGVDLNWEDHVDGTLFVELVKTLRERLPGKLITVPGFMINSNYETVPSWVVELSRYIDQYNVMSYYPATAWIGSGWWSWHNSPLSGAKPNTPISIEDTLRRLAEAGVAKSKLGMGVGLYAIGYSGGITGPNQPTEWGRNEIRGGDNILPSWKLFNSAGLELQRKYRKWDDQAKVPYLSIPLDVSSPFFDCHYISYDDEESIREKGRFARANGYGGIIFWTISQGFIAENPPGSREPLLKAAYETFVLGK